MSMRQRFYIGPFLVVQGKLDVDELTGGSLTGLRGEAGSGDGDVMYIGPNIDVPNIKRPLFLDPECDEDVVEEIDQMGEMLAFLEWFTDEIKAIKEAASDGAVKVRWGIVPGWI